MKKKMYTLEYIRHRLKDANLGLVAEFTGMKYAAVHNIVRRGRDGRYESIVKLNGYIDYLEKMANELKTLEETK